jgi:hypothetical protein
VKNAEFISRNDYVIRVYLNHRIRQTSGELNWSQYVNVPQQAASEMGIGLPQPKIFAVVTAIGVARHKFIQL